MNSWLNHRFTPKDEVNSVADGGIHKAKVPSSNAKPKDAVILPQRKYAGSRASEIAAFKKYGTANFVGVREL